MLLAWSTTEVIRYSFYAFTLLGHVPYQLLWLRYTTFYLLYPIGAASEALGAYATLPVSSEWNTFDYIRALLFMTWWPCKSPESSFTCVPLAEINSSAVRTVYAYGEAKTEGSCDRKNCQTRMSMERCFFIRNHIKIS